MSIEITQEQREQIKQRQVRNALEKLNAGGSLSSREQALIDEITQDDPALRRNRYSISELSQMTGKERRTITIKLEGIPFEPGPKGAMLYDSVIALERIYAIDARRVSLDEARTRHALSQERLNQVREEELRKTRVPSDFVLSVHDQTLQAMVSTLKAGKDKPLTSELINEILEKWRAIPASL